MSLDQLRALLRTYAPGRRARLTDAAAEGRRDKVPQGPIDGTILKVVPLPSDDAYAPAFGVELEIEPAPGRFDSLIAPVADVELAPFSLDDLRRALWRRGVHFPRSSGIGIEFPEGAGDFGVIDDVRIRKGEGGDWDLVVSLRVAVDPAANPRGLTVFHVEADFIQCVLLLRKSSG
jgi:hypothetical protein